LAIKTEGYIFAEPKFKFDVSGYVAVTALGVSVYDNSWELAAYEVGSDLKLGARFPLITDRRSGVQSLTRRREIRSAGYRPGSDDLSGDGGGGIGTVCRRCISNAAIAT